MLALSDKRSLRWSGLFRSLAVGPVRQNELETERAVS